MGLAIDRDEFHESEFAQFDGRLRESLEALKTLLNRSGFGHGPKTIGAELEVSIVDDEGRALFVNEEAIAGSGEPRLELELDRFNLEFNLRYFPAAGRPFSRLRNQLDGALARLNEAVAPHGGQVVPIGIIPTLRKSELTPDAITDRRRYRALNNGLRRLRQQPFRINIDGAEPLQVESSAVTHEGSCTSFQVHLRVNPEDFVDLYNAVQLATPLAMATAVNSPTYLGHVLWKETRVALFKQATDCRSPTTREWSRAARVPFGHGWLRRSVLESFIESVALHPVLIPILTDERPMQVVTAGGLPALRELRLHQGTVWHWNRAIYDPAAGGHIRLEMRAFPGGPTSIDMAANAAFLVGLGLGLQPGIDDRLARFPFRYADYSFHRAAQHGLDARLLWPSDCGNSPHETTVRKLFFELAPLARDGLLSIGVDADEADEMLAVVEHRVQAHQTGASWQRHVLQRLDQAMPRDEALVALLQAYLDRSRSGIPVAEW